MAKALNGVSVSELDGNIDWFRVKNDAAIDFAILRAGFGENKAQIDAAFEEFALSAYKNNILLGVYWQSLAQNEAEAVGEAQTCLSVIKPFSDLITLPVFYKREEADAQKVGKRDYTDCAAAFMKEIRAAGYNAGFYYFPEGKSVRLDVTRLADFEMWLFRSVDPDAARKEPDLEPAVWMYSFNGKVDGITRKTAMNICFKDYGTPNRLSYSKTTHRTKRRRVHIVRSGDTLSSIAHKYNTTYRALMAKNNIKNPNLIYPGQRIIID